jgi:hypothetical protein
MAAVLWQIRWPLSTRAEPKGESSERTALGIGISPRALELEEAKEILAEIFAIDMREVEETIRDRLKDRSEPSPQI